MKNHKFFMPKRQIFKGGPEQGSDFERKNSIDWPASSEVDSPTPQRKELNKKIVDEVRKSLVKLKQKPVVKELTAEEVAIQDKLNKCEVRKQTIEFYLDTIRQIEKSKSEKPGFKIDKKLIESLKEKIVTICDEMEKEAREVLDVLATRDEDKAKAKQYIDYAYDTMDSFK